MILFMCQCGLQAVLLSHIGILLLLSLLNLTVSQYFYFLLSNCMERSCWPSIRWCCTGRFSIRCCCSHRANNIYWSSCSLHFCFPPLSIFLSFMGWYCEAGAFRLIRCRSLSFGLASPTFSNKNNYNNNYYYYRVSYFQGLICRIVLSTGYREHMQKFNLDHVSTEHLQLLLP